MISPTPNPGYLWKYIDLHSILCLRLKSGCTVKDLSLDLIMRMKMMMVESSGVKVEIITMINFQLMKYLLSTTIHQDCVLEY